MSVKSRLLIPAAAVPVVLLTLIAGLMLVGPEERDVLFWLTLIPVLWAECMLGLSISGIGGELSGRFPFFRAGSGIGAAGYLIFTLFMILPYSRECSVECMVCVQTTGLVFWLMLQILFWLAERPEGDTLTGCSSTECNKTGFSLESTALLAQLKSRCPEETELIRESGRLAETVRFAAESVRRSEQIDERIRAGLQQLHVSVAENSPEQTLTEIHRLQELFHRREALIKNLR